MCHRVAFAQTGWPDPLSTDNLISVSLFPTSYTEFDRLRNEFDRTRERTFSLDLGRKLVELKALYTWKSNKTATL
jgi:hypothetical protein